VGDSVKIKTEDKRRKWMWIFLAAVVSLQVYFVWELLAVFALFAIGFAAMAFVSGSLYMLHQGGALVAERIASGRRPVIAATRQGIATIENMAR
jgi:hypothetical protein